MASGQEGWTKEQKRLHNIVIDARAKLNKIETLAIVKANTALVGKCFKYPRNNYSCPEKKSDYWPVYSRVLRLDGHGLICHTFQADKYGDIRIEFAKYEMRLSGYVPITVAEFRRAWGRVKARISLVGE